MPYIKQSDRAHLNCDIDSIIYDLNNLAPLDKRYGPINYTISRIVASALKPKEGWSYHSISRALAVLQDAHDEMRRRLMDKREDQVIKINGDLDEYSEV